MTSKLLASAAVAVALFVGPALAQNTMGANTMGAAGPTATPTTSSRAMTSESRTAKKTTKAHKHHKKHLAAASKGDAMSSDSMSSGANAMTPKK